MYIVSYRGYLFLLLRVKARVSFFMISYVRLDGQKVNLREQHDAFEFFNTLVDSIDEGLKSFGTKQVLSGVLGGSFADQKICKGCPHRLAKGKCSGGIRDLSNKCKSVKKRTKDKTIKG